MSDAIEALLARQIGLDVGSIGKRAIELAINTRMAACRVRDPDSYFARLTGSGEELAALIEEVVVPETWFLRDKTPFVQLGAHARTAWHHEIRALSVPCSTGEEPYSIAIALTDAGFAPSAFSIDAYDVSARALAIAERGVYGAASFRGDFGDLRERHFSASPRGEGWAIRADLRERVRFARGNLLDPGCFERTTRYHVIFCRNLLIYLTGDARTAVLRRLESMLEPHGRFVVGHAEALQVMDPRFRPVEGPGSFTFARAHEARSRRRSTAPRLPATSASPAPARPPAKAKPTARIKPLPPPPAARDLLAEAASLANRGDLVAAAERCGEHLALHSGDAAGYALLGTIQQAGGKLDDAEQCFSRALYCDPAHYPSLMQLALLREGRGDAEGAAQLRRRAARARKGER